VKIWNHVQSYLPNWFSTNSKTDTESSESSSDISSDSMQLSVNDETGTELVVEDKVESIDSGAANIDLAKESLTQLLADTRVPDSVREVLNDEYKQLKTMLTKLEEGHLHIAVFGRVSVGKSSVFR